MNRLLIQLTGISICSHGITLDVLTDGNMPDFELRKVAICIKNKLCEHRMFIVNSVVSYICMQVHNVIDNGLFILLSVNTELDNDNIVFWIGDDKSRKEMQFKFGFNIMNQAMVNSL